MGYHITLIVLKTITLLAVGSLHINYMLNAIHPQSLITGILALFILYSLSISIYNVASLKLNQWQTFQVSRHKLMDTKVDNFPRS
jgi:hypothetical protein